MRGRTHAPTVAVAAPPTLAGARGPLLQRTCSCGREAPHGGECEECRKKAMLRREATGPAPARAPALVQDVLASPGQPLDVGARAALEPRFGHDFGRVRVHAGPRAAESARAVRALAYTVGEHVVFGQGQYAPDRSEGRRLLAHELTHVLQQRGSGTRMQSHAISPPLIGRPGDPLEDEAERVADSVAEEDDGAAPPPITGAGRTGIQRISDPMGEEPMEPRGHEPFEGVPESVRRGSTLPYREATELSRCLEIMGDENAAYCRQEVLGEAPPPPLPPPLCEPDRELTWADFTGTPPASSAFAARTAFRFDRETHLGTELIRAFLRPSASWVKAKARDPTNRAVNGCASQVAECEQHFDDAEQQGLVNVTWHLGPSTGCAAAVQPDTTLEATSRGECDSLLGAECDRVAELESRRLLRHEQYHFKLACEMAKKGTRAMATRSSSQADAVLRAVRRKAAQQTSRYDHQTTHGCNAGAQATWESNIDGGLPAVTIP